MNLENIPESPRLVLEILNEFFSNPDIKKVFPSHNYIGKKIGKGRRTVLRACHWLRDHGFISWIGQIRENKQRSTNIYTKKAEKQTMSQQKVNKPKEKNNNLNNNSYSYIAPEPTKIPELLDKSTAQEFIAHWFGNKPVTFQVIAETQEAIERKEAAESRKDYRYMNRFFHGSLEKYWEILAKYNQNGYGIHIAVNDTDGKGRKIENVTNINGFFLDMDGEPLDELINFTKRYNMEPTILVQSSPGKYHAYWKTDNCPMSTWPGIQKTLAKRFGGDAGSMAVNKTLRCPGFVHQKSQPVTVRVWHMADSILPYSRARRLFPVEKPKPVNRNFQPTGKMWENVEYGSSQGSRNWDLYRFVCRMRGCKIDQFEAENNAVHYAECCSPPLKSNEAVNMVKRVWAQYQPGGK
jgi:hypothetical protein